MSYSPIDKPTDFFNTLTYTGNGVDDTAKTGLGFQPDWNWTKQRSGAEWHTLIDSVRGVTKYINSNDTNAERTNSNFIESFDSNGFTLGSANDTNQNSQTYASWNWKAGTSFTNDASGTGIGSIDSAGSVNQDAGFSIISYTGNGNDDDTAKIAHGLGVAANMIIVKCRNAAGGWQTSSTSLGFNNVLQLNETNAQASGTYAFGRTGVAPTSTVFTVSATSGGNHTNTNNNTYIAYCFAEKKGYSKFGSYTGNGNADGSFIYTGFKPAFVMSKCTSHAGEDWNINDDKRPGYNVIQNALLPNSSAAEVTASFQAIDTLSNGFKWRGTNDRVNASGKTYIYMAFAESPFVGSNFVPNNAR